jgi:hypothetical protein
LVAARVKPGQLGVPETQSKHALCASSGWDPTKSAASRMTLAAGGASWTIALVMPVSRSMKAGM